MCHDEGKESNIKTVLTRKVQQLGIDFGLCDRRFVWKQKVRQDVDVEKGGKDAQVLSVECAIRYDASQPKSVVNLEKWQALRVALMSVIVKSCRVL